jgi:hypothetical protein
MSMLHVPPSPRTRYILVTVPVGYGTEDGRWDTERVGRWKGKKTGANSPPACMTPTAELLAAE